MPKVLIYVSHPSDVTNCKEALKRLRCRDPIVNNISDVNDLDLAIVQVFDRKLALDSVKHLVTDATPGVRVLRAIREKSPQCAILALSHHSCISGYVESTLLVDRCIDIDWAKLPPAHALSMESLVTNGLKRAQEAHPVVLQEILRRSGKDSVKQGADANAQPAA